MQRATSFCSTTSSSSSTISTPPNSPSLAALDAFEQLTLTPSPDELSGRLGGLLGYAAPDGLAPGLADDKEIDRLAEEWLLPEAEELFPQQQRKRKEVWTWSFQEKRLKMFQYPVAEKKTHAAPSEKK